MIYKYFPRKPTGVIGDQKNQKYFSDNVFDSAIRAKEYLAIPYEPLYRIAITPYKNNYNTIWEAFEGSTIDQTKRRVWAAFGRHGGAWEKVTKQQFLENEKNLQKGKGVYAGTWSIDKILYTGGYIEEYCHFRKPTEHNLILNLLKRFLKNYSRRGENQEFGEIKEGFQWKIRDDFLGGIFYWVANQFKYTISVLVKAHEKFYNGLKFWGVFWKDGDNKRKVYKPVEVIVPGFPLIEEGDLADTQNSSDFEIFLDSKFGDIRKTLVEKSKLILQDKISENYDIQLP